MNGQTKVTFSAASESIGKDTSPEPTEQLSDHELVEAAKVAAPGDHRAFTELLERYQRRVHANCRYLTSPEEADDLTQEVLVKAYFGLPRFHGRSSFRVWLDRIKSNHCINHLRTVRRLRSRLAPLEEAERLVHPAPEESIPERISERRKVDEVLLQISETLRVPLVLSDMDGFNLAEIAEMLDIGLSAVKMRVARGREEFRRLYDGGQLEGPGEI